MVSQIRPRGVIVVEPANELDFFLPETQLLLNDFLQESAITLERIHFTQIAMQTEKLLAREDVASPIWVKLSLLYSLRIKL